MAALTQTQIDVIKQAYTATQWTFFYVQEANLVEMMDLLSSNVIAVKAIIECVDIHDNKVYHFRVLPGLKRELTDEEKRELALDAL